MLGLSSPVNPFRAVCPTSTPTQWRSAETSELGEEHIKRKLSLSQHQGDWRVTFGLEKTAAPLNCEVPQDT